MEIKPCPFCGKEPSVEYYEPVEGNGLYSINCKYCEIGPSTLDHINKGVAIKKWNERVEPLSHQKPEPEDVKLQATQHVDFLLAIIECFLKFVRWLLVEVYCHGYKHGREWEKNQNVSQVSEKAMTDIDCDHGETVARMTEDHFRERLGDELFDWLDEHAEPDEAYMEGE